MKSRIIAVVVLIMALFASESVSSAKHNVGVIGGATFSTQKFSEINKSTFTQYHAGLAFKFRLPIGFAIQPSVLYQVKGTKLTDAQNLGVGYLEVPVSVQWGPDLVICRPFVEAVPFVGFGLNNNVGDIKNNWNNLNRWEYGLGLGAGIDIWRFQINCRYNWNFGSLAKVSNESLKEELNAIVGDSANSAKNFSGITLSLAFYF